MEDYEKDELKNAKFIVCYYCRNEISTDSKNCFKCPVRKLRDEIDLYENEEPEEFKDYPVEYLICLQDLTPYEDEWYYESHSAFGVSGIYGIFIDDQLVYIGQSNNIYVRWIGHAKNVFDFETESYDKPLYSELRYAYLEEHEVIFKVMEYVPNDEALLNEAEDKWLLKCMPPYNQIVPNKKGWHFNKGFEYIPISKSETTLQIEEEVNKFLKLQCN